MKRSKALRIIDHAQPEQFGGTEPITVTLPDGRRWAMSRVRVTWTRGDCVRGTPITGSLEDRRRGFLCGACLCRHSLLTTDSRDMPGTPRHGHRPPGRPRPIWVEGELPARGSCALDVVELLGPQSCRQIAPRLGLHSQRAVEFVARRALDRLEAAGLDPALIAAMRALLDHETNIARAQANAL